jgi:molecular chaperone Hsp33
VNDALRNQGDVVIPFLFEKLPVRGALIQLQRSWARMQLGNDYSPRETGILGQSAAATGLIAQSLKFRGKITLQVSGAGPLSMLVMQSTEKLEMRGMVRAPAIHEQMSYSAMVDSCRCAITVDAGAMERPYQGIVEMLGDALSQSLENYFARSVQVRSHMTLVADQSVSGGILLQQMPEKGKPLEDDWRRLGLLASTLRTDDLSDGIAAMLVGKLFAEDDVRVFRPRPVVFRCGCSRERTEEVLRLLGEEETRSACEEQGKVDVICEYCGRKRSFDSVDISRIFTDQPITGSATLH